ncbi:unnamed protein product [Heligmosomoides polygyrus]|uniref:Uncharacterized protein n=1 Tax=Heligmosomoides polygyrus TaxID=6339 RepID=A0A183FIE1_HELPZ|nr:unnamed protein product [Heligmosomoides polygyrus]
MWMDPSGQGAKRGCWGSDEDSPDPAEDEGAAPKVVRTRPQKARESPRKVGPRFRGTRKASERSPKEKVEGCHQEISPKSAPRQMTPLIG